MRLANICLFEGRPTLFDGIEFSDEIACIDVLHDLAFVLMDLQHHQLADLAPTVLRAYLERVARPRVCTVAAVPIGSRGDSQLHPGRQRPAPATAEAAQAKAEQARALLRQSRLYLLDHQALGLGYPQLVSARPRPSRSHP